MKEIINAMANVHDHNIRQMVPNPNGRYPSCKNALGTWLCEKCGRDVREKSNKACSASRPEERWDSSSETKEVEQ